jgi:muconolactone delta-isomerase
VAFSRAERLLREFRPDRRPISGGITIDSLFSSYERNNYFRHYCAVPSPISSRAINELRARLAEVDFADDVHEQFKPVAKPSLPFADNDRLRAASAAIDRELQHLGHLRHLGLLANIQLAALEGNRVDDAILATLSLYTYVVAAASQVTDRMRTIFADAAVPGSSRVLANERRVADQVPVVSNDEIERLRRQRAASGPAPAANQQRGRSPGRRHPTRSRNNSRSRSGRDGDDDRRGNRNRPNDRQSRDRNRDRDRDRDSDRDRDRDRRDSSRSRRDSSRPSN